MNCLYQGTFYNGISSIPQNVNVSFDSEKAVISISDESVKTTDWQLENLTFEHRGDALYIQHGDDPIENLKIIDKELIGSLDNFRNTNGLKNLYQKLMELDFKTHISIAVGLLGLIVLGYIYLLPWIAEKSVALIPTEYDNKIGNAFFEQNMMFQEIDSVRTIELNRFAQELKLKNSQNLNLIVADSPIVNAFALPNGTIVVFSGILKPMKNYEELAGLIGHEVSHVNNRHSMKMLCRNLSGYLFVSALLGDVNGIMAVIGDNVNSIRSLSFSREFEHQADTDGLEIVKANKVNPQGMIDLFKMLQNEEKKIKLPLNVKIPDFMKTHPVTTERIQYITDLIKKNPSSYSHDTKLQEIFLKIKN